ncbi:protein yellow isoform X4 [Daktulosphaira vitifoliae]|uniref:protein yellow isoform X4 n=1 Tax=Daktulosphaira vitifoliae TaxID=58002 RepID=UPI0021AAEC66|nr:protein yellow isoform X4 [Daktulosphaira vitifoliae]
MAQFALALLLLGLFSNGVLSVNDRLREVFNWRQVDFVFPDQQTRQQAINNREFIQANNMPLGLEVWRNRLFITVPRWKAGVASTLNYINLDSNNKSSSPSLIPYPNFENNLLSSNSSERIVSVFRINVDECDRLWMVDTGLADIWGEANQVQTPKLLIFDLKTDKLIRQYTFKADDMKPDSFFANVLADTTKETCNDAYAYIPDLGAYGLIVYSFATNKSWRVKHHYFHFDPLAGNYHVGGINFQWTDGIFGVALSAVKEDGFRTLYFHPFSSTREFSVSTRIIQNASIASDSYYEFKVLGSRGPNSQASGSSLDEKTGVLFYTQVNKDGIGCWNSNRFADEYSADTNALVVSDSITLEFPNDLKVDNNGNLWVLSDRLPRFLYKGLDTNDVNFRIFNAPVVDLVKDTVCEVQQ